MTLNAHEEDSNLVTSIRVTIRREVTDRGPLFPPSVSYQGVITATMRDGSSSGWAKDFGRISFQNLQQQIEYLKDEWLTSGLTEEQIIIDYGKENAS